MSRLTTLGITNVRSFGDANGIQVIRFDPCLTLIQGQNGSGKTVRF